jgi:hypothetical protein
MEEYRDFDEWTRKAILNVAASGTWVGRQADCSLLLPALCV